MHKQLTITFWREAYFGLAREVDQVLGKDLGYPYYCTDQKNFPGTVVEDGICTGDNVSESLLAEAARKLTEKPLTFSESDNTPCTAQLEVELEKLATYFDRRARENKRRAGKLEQKLSTFHDISEYLESDRSSYYFSGKEDSYKNAAFKLRSLLVKDAQ